MPVTVYAFGQAIGDVGVSTPALNSAVDVMTFIVEPGATAAVSAKSLKPALFAIARMLPVDGWSTTIALCGCIFTAARAGFSARGVIVVARVGMLFGLMTDAWL